MATTTRLSIENYTPGQRVRIVNPFFRRPDFHEAAPKEWEGFEATVSHETEFNNSLYVLLKPLSERPDGGLGEFYWCWYQLEGVE